MDTRIETGASPAESRAAADSGSGRPGGWLTHAGYELSSIYEPAAGQPAGGDLCGVWPLPHGQLAVLIGDVTGRGAGSAAISARTHSLFEALLRDLSPPGEVLGQANARIGPSLPPEAFVTAFLAVCSRGRIRYARAGHWPPLVFAPAGRTSLSGTGGLPLGVAADSTYSEGEVALEPDSLVFAYTDGLLEARRAGETLGERRLGELVAAERDAASDLDQLVRRVHEGVLAWSEGIDDDMVALALRRS